MTIVKELNRVDQLAATSGIKVTGIQVEMPDPTWRSYDRHCDGRDALRSQVSDLDLVEAFETAVYGQTETADDGYHGTLYYQPTGVELDRLFALIAKEKNELVRVSDLVKGISFMGGTVSLPTGWIDDTSCEHDWTDEETEYFEQNYANSDIKVSSGGVLLI